MAKVINLELKREDGRLLLTYQISPEIEEYLKNNFETMTSNNWKDSDGEYLSYYKVDDDFRNNVNNIFYSNSVRTRDKGFGVRLFDNDDIFLNFALVRVAGASERQITIDLHKLIPFSDMEIAMKDFSLAVKTFYKQFIKSCIFRLTLSIEEVVA